MVSKYAKRYFKEMLDGLKTYTNSMLGSRNISGIDELQLEIESYYGFLKGLEEGLNTNQIRKIYTRVLRKVDRNVDLIFYKFMELVYDHERLAKNSLFIVNVKLH